MKKIRWTDRVRNEEVLHRVKKERNSLHKIKKKRKSSWIGHILRRDCHLKLIIEGKIEGVIKVMERQRRRCRKQLDNFKETRGYWNMKERTLDSCQWRPCFGRGYVPEVRQTTKWIND
jgi:hypothetical protein